MSYLVLKCGSAARGDANSNSDIDFVCLHAPCFKRFKQIKKKYLNISFYSQATVRKMKGKGSLFLTHLDLEGTVVEGDKDLLKDVAGYKPTTLQLDNTIQSTKRFVSGIGWFPDSPTGFLWLCDVLFVSLRNILYCKNALAGKFFFALDQAISNYGLNPIEAETVFQIRKGKYAFRSKSHPAVEVNLAPICSLASRLVGGDIKLTKGGRTAWDRKWQYDYWDERLVERAILNNELRDSHFLSLLRDHNYNRRTLVKEIRKRVEGFQHQEDSFLLK